MSELRGGDVVVRPRPCVHCKVAGDAQLARQITGAGATNVLWVCLTCNRATPAQSGGLYVPHVKLEALGIIPDDLPVWRDYSKDTRCVACGARGAEVHHWAPRALFGDEADSWPTDMLCPTCHERWHKTLATPGAVR